MDSSTDDRAEIDALMQSYLDVLGMQLDLPLAVAA